MMDHLPDDAYEVTMAAKDDPKECECQGWTVTPEMGSWKVGEEHHPRCSKYIGPADQAQLARERLEELKETLPIEDTFRVLTERHEALFRVVDAMSSVIWWSQTAEMAPRHHQEELRAAWMHLRDVAAKTNLEWTPAAMAKRLERGQSWANKVMGESGPDFGPGTSSSMVCRRCGDANFYVTNGPSGKAWRCANCGERLEL